MKQPTQNPSAPFQSRRGLYENLPGMTAVADWQRAVLPALRDERFGLSASCDVPLLSYFYWHDSRIESEFYQLECAFLCAFHCFGLMPGLLVTNQTTPRMSAFCRQIRQLRGCRLSVANMILAFSLRHR